MKIAKALFWIILILCSLVSIEIFRWYVAGSRQNWIILTDHTASKVVVALDLDSFKILVAHRPSGAWDEYLERGPVGLFHCDAEAFNRAKAAGRIIYLPNGTGALDLRREVDFGDLLGDSFKENKLQIHRIAVEIKFREGPHKDLKAWVIPELIQHEIAWP